jgi:hypothetical protein
MCRQMVDVEAAVAIYRSARVDVARPKSPPFGREAGKRANAGRRRD